MSDDDAGANGGEASASAGDAGGSDEGLWAALSGVDEFMLDSFTWYSVAKKEFQDTVRSKLIWALSAVFIIIFALPVFLGAAFGFGSNISQLTTDQFFQQRAILASGLIPIIAIVVGYAAIVGERESGSLKVLLSLPFTRTDVLVGKVIGRSAVVALPILLAFLVSALVLAPAGAQLKPLGFVLGSLLTALLGVVFVGLAVGFSAAVSTSRRALIATLGVYVYFFLFWNAFSQAVGTLLRTQLGADPAQTLKIQLFIKLLNPTQSYQTLVTSALGQSPIMARTSMFRGMRSIGVCQQALGGNVSMSQAGGFSCQATGAGMPFYYSDPAVAVYFLVWLVVPVYLGYRLFNDADL
jgi:ABC-2 type transport system permease protein